MQKIKYINNKDLLAEIKVCKASFCHFIAPEWASYDVIVSNVEDITVELLTETIRLKANRLSTKTVPVDPSSIDPSSVVFRVMTDGHLPPTDEKNRRRMLANGDLIKTNFSPFRHYILKDNVLVEVGRSHWRGDFDSGQFSVEHGRMSNRLATMFMLLVEQYSRRGNWRGYCVDENTEALTQRGWLRGDQVTTDDMILSYNQENNRLVWSKIKSVFRDDYDGYMFKLDVAGMDALVTPHHKFVTTKGLKEVDLLIEKDRLILMGNPVEDTGPPTYTDEFVELVGWTVTEANYYHAQDRNYSRVTIYQNEGPKSDRIRHCLHKLGATYSEIARPHLSTTGQTNMAFSLTKTTCIKLLEVAPDRVPSMPFLLALTESQRELLLQTMIDGDGSRTKSYEQHCYKGGYLRYSQKDKAHLDAFLALCTLAGHRTTTRVRNIISFGKPTTIHEVNLFSKTYDRHRYSTVENIDFHGGKRSGQSYPGRGKHTHPNQPTVGYKGWVWCPETEYGTFIARRNGTIWASSNTYVDEMRSHALVQLAQVGLQFDESRSDNPFAFYTQIIKNCFRRLLNLEHRAQTIRDDLLIMAGAMPSFTRQIDNEIDQREYSETATVADKAKRGRKPKAK